MAGDGIAAQDEGTSKETGSTDDDRKPPDEAIVDAVEGPSLDEALSALQASVEDVAVDEETPSAPEQEGGDPDAPPDDLDATSKDDMTDIDPPLLNSSTAPDDAHAEAPVEEESPVVPSAAPEVPDAPNDVAPLDLEKATEDSGNADSEKSAVEEVTAEPAEPDVPQAPEPAPVSDSAPVPTAPLSLDGRQEHGDKKVSFAADTLDSRRTHRKKHKKRSSKSRKTAGIMEEGKPDDAVAVVDGEGSPMIMPAAPDPPVLQEEAMVPPSVEAENETGVKTEDPAEVQPVKSEAGGAQTAVEEQKDEQDFEAAVEVPTSEAAKEDAPSSTDNIDGGLDDAEKKDDPNSDAATSDGPCDAAAAAGDAEEAQPSVPDAKEAEEDIIEAESSSNETKSQATDVADASLEAAPTSDGQENSPATPEQGADDAAPSDATEAAGETTEAVSEAQANADDDHPIEEPAVNDQVVERVAALPDKEIPAIEPKEAKEKTADADEDVPAVEIETPTEGHNVKTASPEAQTAAEAPLSEAPTEDAQSTSDGSVENPPVIEASSDEAPAAEVNEPEKGIHTDEPLPVGTVAPADDVEGEAAAPEEEAANKDVVVDEPSAPTETPALPPDDAAIDEPSPPEVVPSDGEAAVNDSLPPETAPPNEDTVVNDRPSPEPAPSNEDAIVDDPSEDAAPAETTLPEPDAPSPDHPTNDDATDPPKAPTQDLPPSPTLSKSSSHKHHTSKGWVRKSNHPKDTPKTSSSSHRRNSTSNNSDLGPRAHYEARAAQLKSADDARRLARARERLAEEEKETLIYEARRAGREAAREAARNAARDAAREEAARVARREAREREVRREERERMEGEVEEARRRHRRRRESERSGRSERSERSEKSEKSKGSVLEKGGRDKTRRRESKSSTSSSRPKLSGRAFTLMGGESVARAGIFVKTAGEKEGREHRPSSKRSGAERHSEERKRERGDGREDAPAPKTEPISPRGEKGEGSTSSRRHRHAHSHSHSHAKDEQSERRRHGLRDGEHCNEDAATTSSTPRARGSSDVRTKDKASERRRRDDSPDERRRHRRPSTRHAEREQGKSGFWASIFGK